MHFSNKAFQETTNKLLTSEVINRALLNAIPYPAMLIRKDRRVITVNTVAKEAGVKVGSYCWDTFGKKASISNEDKEYFEINGIVPPKGIKCTFCKADDALKSQNAINEKIPAGNIIYDTYWIPLTNDVYLHYAIVIEPE